MGSINSIPSLVQLMAWHRPCDMVNLLSHIYVFRFEWVKSANTVPYTNFLCRLYQSHIFITDILGNKLLTHPCECIFIHFKPDLHNLFHYMCEHIYEWCCMLIQPTSAISVYFVFIEFRHLNPKKPALLYLTRQWSVNLECEKCT